MVRHVILWQLKDELSDEQKIKVKSEIKESLEALKGKIAGLNDIRVYCDCLETSNADLMLDALLQDKNALNAYAVHPEHVKAANEKVKPFAKQRVCMDFEV